MKIPVIAVGAVLLAGCGGSSPDDECDGPALGLDGRWFGSVENASGLLDSLEWQICGSQIIDERLSGIDFGITGSLVAEGAGVYSLRFSDGVRGWLIADDRERYGLVITQAGEFALLQRGAIALPLYFYEDLDGVWSGWEAQTSGQAITLAAAASLACSFGFCSASAADGWNATLDFPFFDSAFGLWQGDYADVFDSGIAAALLSPDRRQVATYACPEGFSWPRDCRFAVLGLD